MSWMEQVQALPANRVAVQHVPETPRYQRCRQVLEYMIPCAHYLGCRVGEGDPSEIIEIAFWSPSASRRSHGFYACARLYLDAETVYYAVVFAFYDGTESSPGFRSLEAAQAYALGMGFIHED